MAGPQIRRKPVPGSDTKSLESADVNLDRLKLDTDSTVLQGPDAQFSLSPQATFDLQPGDEVLDILSPVDSSTSQSSGKSLTFKSAFEDVRHFAGGLISHPYEVSRHFSIMRHSHGLVYFKGFTTNIAITIFGDQALPDGRQFWLQKRGYSGKTGLKLGASMFGTKAAWINVTPTTRCKPEQLPPSDERAWQRDIDKFLKKASKDVRTHLPLETCVLRIPCSAEDGYFRVIMCTGEKGKKTLCPSPIFRLVSTSASMGSLRGASLSTMPLELVIKIGQFAARRAAMNAAAPLAGQAAQQVKNAIPWQPSSFVQQQALSTVQSSAQGRIESAHEHAEEIEQMKIDHYIAHMQDSIEHAQVLGADTGPEQPYPVRFSATASPCTERRDAGYCLPMIDISNMPDDVALRLSGTYFGYLMPIDRKELDPHESMTDGWYSAIVWSASSQNSKVKVVSQKRFSAYLICEGEEIDLMGARLKVMVMGRIRQTAAQHRLDEEKDLETEMVCMLQDIATAQKSLSRPAWQPEETLLRVKTDRSNRSLNERYADARGSIQKGVDKVPVHLAGVRTDSMALRDRLVGNGGVWVVR